MATPSSIPDRVPGTGARWSQAKGKAREAMQPLLGVADLAAWVRALGHKGHSSRTSLCLGAPRCAGISALTLEPGSCDPYQLSLLLVKEVFPERFFSRLLLYAFFHSKIIV